MLAACWMLDAGCWMLEGRLEDAKNVFDWSGVPVS
jgi:hypothetical protein